tara:strand:+ start:1932 stop:2405 length:474 start_codon:yes stop_codon:yes gene_type:complete
MEIDRTDRRILEIIQKQGRISNLELAEAIGLSATPCARRIKRLEDDGVITSHVTLLDPDKLDLKLTAILGITMDKHTPERFENFDRNISTFPEVLECNVVTGQASDYLLKVIVPDMKYYEEFLLGRLTRIDGVTGVHSSFVLRKVFNKTALPLGHTC